MTRVVTDFGAVRRAAGLHRETLARMTGLTVGRLEEIEAGAHARPEELDAWARAFGVRIQDLSGADPESWPLSRLAFRAANEGAPALDALIEDGSYQVLGDFLRCVAEVDELEGYLGHSRKALPRLRVPSGWADEPPWGADRLAAQVREAFGISATKPIGSLTALLRDELGVACFFVTPEELAPSIDAASSRYPRPAVLVNLIEGEHAFWRTRMSLAHELCHLLVDQSEADPANVSPHSSFRGRYEYFQDFRLIEARANAFAAHLLAPDAGVKEAVGTRRPSSEDAIVAVSQTFGIGRVTAISRLKHVFGLGDQARERMIKRAHSSWVPGEGFEEEAPVGLRDGVLLDLATEAYSKGLIDAVDIRRRLEIELIEELPDRPELSAQERAPVRDAETQVLSVVGSFLVENDVRGAVPVRPRRTDDGWTVELDGDPEGRFVTVSFDFEVEPPAWLAA